MIYVKADLLIFLQLFIQDKEDDLKVGVKSTALRFGDSTKEWISGFGLACISSLAISGVNADIGNYFPSLIYLGTMVLCQSFLLLLICHTS